MKELHESQKQALRFLVKAVREKLISDEFTLTWTKARSTASVLGNAINTQVPNLTRLTADLLTEIGYLYSGQETEADLGQFSIGRGNARLWSRTCLITLAGFRALDSEFSPVEDGTVHRPPVEITNSLANLRKDWPDSTRLAFVMMPFGTSDAHCRILSSIRNALRPHGLTALRADDKQYHDDLYYNILTYIYGTRFGIAVFDRIERNDANPNVSLEVGYMFGLEKSVCLLKDKTLPTLTADLVGKLYRPFDPQHPEDTIPPELFEWMDQKGFIVRHGRAG